jgi:hypothetical protein
MAISEATTAILWEDGGNESQQSVSVVEARLDERLGVLDLADPRIRE